MRCMNQDTIATAQLIEQEVDQLNQQLHIIDENLRELHALKESLEDLESPSAKEIMVNIGKRVFIPVEIKEKKLLIDVGKNNFLKKTIPQTQELINEQINRLMTGKTQMMVRLRDLEKEMEQLIKKLEAGQKS